jgi:hypothetical protein
MLIAGGAIGASIRAMGFLFSPYKMTYKNRLDHRVPCAFSGVDGG